MITVISIAFKWNAMIIRRIRGRNKGALREREAFLTDCSSTRRCKRGVRIQMEIRDVLMLKYYFFQYEFNLKQWKNTPETKNYINGKTFLPLVWSEFTRL